MSNKPWRENFSMVDGSVDYKPIWYQTQGMVEYAHKSGVGKNFSDVLMIFVNHGLNAFIPADQIDDYVSEILEKIIHEPDWVSEIHSKTIAVNNEFFNCCQKVEAVNLSDASANELVCLNDEIIKYQVPAHELALPTTWFLDSNGETFTKYLIEQVAKSMPKNLEFEPDTYSVYYLLRLNRVLLIMKK